MPSDSAKTSSVASIAVPEPLQYSRFSMSFLISGLSQPYAVDPACLERNSVATCSSSASPTVVGLRLRPHLPSLLLSSLDDFMAGLHHPTAVGVVPPHHVQNSVIYVYMYTYIYSLCRRSGRTSVVRQPFGELFRVSRLCKV